MFVHMFGLTRPKPDPDVPLRLERLERSMKELRLDWDLTYEKFQRLSARLAKRARDAEERAGSPVDGRSDGAMGVTNPLAARLLGR